MNEGVAAILAALIAFGGVGLGLRGARWQYRGALEQANAAREAAQETAQAAIEAVKAQGRDQNQQWRRTVRREVWAQFLATLAKVDQAGDAMAKSGLVEDYERAAESLADAQRHLADLRNQIGVIELEGPAEISELAADVVRAYGGAINDKKVTIRGQQMFGFIEQLAHDGNAHASRLVELLNGPGQVPPNSWAEMRRVIVQIGPEFHTIDVRYIERFHTERVTLWEGGGAGRDRFVDAAREHLDGE
ncbi:hypothetical protein ACIBI4_06220 [Streptomyces sp. NPDC050418]|uniref:hypothetical protein n=1 Tax=Streptomyces sp. NPDC050418 TaxID=3365612 RepID=UPI0037A45510